MLDLTTSAKKADHAAALWNLSDLAESGLVPVVGRTAIWLWDLLAGFLAVDDRDGGVGGYEFVDFVAQLREGRESGRPSLGLEFLWSFWPSSGLGLTDRSS